MNPRRSTPFVPAVIAAWLAYVVVDFLTHAVFLSPWWRATGSHWLPPAELFARIPYAYLSFGIYALVLVWLMARIVGSEPSGAEAIRFGAVAGLVCGTLQALASYSIVSMPPSALIVWPISVVLASAAAAVAAASVFRAPSAWKRALVVLGITLALFVAGVVIQNLFFPTPSDRLVHGVSPLAVASQ